MYSENEIENARVKFLDMLVKHENMRHKGAAS